jgi:hypothetical protein
MPRGKVYNPKTRAYGPVVDIGGLIEIREPVDEAKHVYRATVVHSVGAVELNAVVTEQPLPKVDFSSKGPHIDLAGIVIGGQFGSQRKILGQGSTIYIDRGTANGLSEGQILAVHSDRELRRENTNFPEYSRPIATIKIARVFEHVATAVVISAIEEIHPGDFTGGPLPRAAEKVTNLRANNNRPVEIHDREEEQSYKEEMTGSSGDDDLDLDE